MCPISICPIAEEMKDSQLGFYVSDTCQEVVFLIPYVYVYVYVYCCGPRGFNALLNCFPYFDFLQTPC